MLWLPAGADRTPRNAPLVRPPPAAGVTSTSATSTQSSSGGPLRCGRWSFGGLAPDRAAVRHPRAHVGAAPTGRVLQAATYRATRWTRTRARHRLTARHRHASRAVLAAFQPLASRVGRVSRAAWWTDGCRCRPKLAALSWAPTRCSGAAVLRERRRERRGWAATGGGAKERRRGWGLGKNRLKHYFLCNQWHWWVITHQLHEEVQKWLFWSS